MSSYFVVPAPATAADGARERLRLRPIMHEFLLHGTRENSFTPNLLSDHTCEDFASLEFGDIGAIIKKRGIEHQVSVCAQLRRLHAQCQAAFYPTRDPRVTPPTQAEDEATLAASK
jgi:hypothetical protein